MSREKKIGVSKIVINIGDKEAALTVEQAKELRDALSAVLGEKIVERVIERDRWYPYQPYIVYGNGTLTAATTTTWDNTGTYAITLDDSNLLSV